MDISVEVVEENCLVRLKGELDMHSVPEFKEEISNKMEKYDLLNLILNLRGIKFIDSSGLGAILGRYRHLEKQGGKVALVAIKPQVEKIFKLAGILKIMSKYQDEKSALENLKGGYKG